MADAYLVPVLLEKLDFLLRKGRHGDGLHSVRRVQPSSVGGEREREERGLEGVICFQESTHAVRNH